MTREEMAETLRDFAWREREYLAMVCDPEHPENEEPAVIAQKLEEIAEVLETQQEDKKRMISWLGKFCAHVDNGFKPMPDKENVKFFQEKLKQQFGWDVEHTEEQETVEPHVERDCDDGTWYYGCGNCHNAIDYKDKFCRHCGRAVNWDE